MYTDGSTIQELFEEMESDYKIFCNSAQRFVDSVKEQPTNILIKHEIYYK